MKKLFAVRSTKKEDGIIDFFEDKKKAKKKRDELNEKSKTAEFVVSRGPDHLLGASGTRAVKRTESQKKRLKGGSAFFR